MVTVTRLIPKEGKKMNPRTYRDLRSALHNIGGNLAMLREYLGYVEKILQAGSYPESQQQLAKVQEARIKFQDEVSQFEKVCKSEISEPDPQEPKNPGRVGG